MALFHSPQIVTNNLALSYDTANRKSYQGPPVQNRLTGIGSSTGGSAGFSQVAGSEVVDVPTIGPTSVITNRITNNYPAVSTNCCPAPFSYGSGIAVTGSTLYTYGIVYRVESGYTNANYMYRYEFNGGTYVMEAGVHNEANRISLGQGWFWAWGTFTTNPATTNLVGLASFYYRYSTLSDKMSVAKILLVQGDYSGLHPRYWPEVNITRSASQAIVDQTKNYALSASNIVFSSAGVVSFSEAASSTITTNLNVASVLPALSSFTLEAWVRVSAWPTNTTTNGFGSNVKAGSIVGACYYSGTAIRWGGNSNGNGITVFGFVRGEDAYRNTANYSVPALNVYNHFVFTNNSSAGGMSLYVNGVLFSTVGAATQQYTPSLVSSIGNLAINRADVDGGGTQVYSHLNGNIDAVRVYTQALTAGQVLSNFNALKGRFGL